MGERRNECYLNIGLVSQYPVFWSEKKYETFAVNNEIEKEEEDDDEKPPRTHGRATK